MPAKIMRFLLFLVFVLGYIFIVEIIWEVIVGRLEKHRFGKSKIKKSQDLGKKVSGNDCKKGGPYFG